MKESGIWSSLLIDDINGDGHADIIAGNVGNNLPFKATPAFPLSLTVTDLDDNGAAEVLFSYFIQGKLYPAASRDELLDQVVPLRKKFIKYHQYATVELTDLVPPAKMNEAGKLSVSEIRHIAYMSDGKGNYTPQALPVLSQSSRIFAASSLQIGGNKKGYLLAGNFYPWRTQWGRNDSGLGNLLTFENNEFKLAENSRIGLFMDGDIRDMAIIRNSDDHQLVIVVRNNGHVQVLKTLNR
jgi:hypothetical protein